MKRSLRTPNVLLRGCPSHYARLLAFALNARGDKVLRDRRILEAGEGNLYT